MEVCPACKKKAAPQFMWHSEDGTTSKCLECYHKEKNSQPVKRREVETTLKSESKTAGYAMKAAGIFLAAIILVAAALCLFYKPKPMKAPLADAAQAARDAAKLAKTAAKAAADKAMELAASGETADGDKKDEKDKSDNTSPAVDTDAAKKAADAASNKILAAVGGKNKDGSDKERMAPTVQALTANMPQTQGQHPKDSPAPSVISEFVDKANEAAAAVQGGPGSAAPAQLKPNGETKAKVEQTQAAVMATASALIQKSDADGTKTADALAKLGSVSSAFAEVASQLAPPAPLQTTKGGAGGLGSTDASTTPTGGRLEADVLASQGKSGYDPLEAVRRETEEGVKANPALIAVQKDPHAPKPESSADAAKSEAAAIRSAGIVERNTTLATAGLPEAFAAAVEGQQGNYAIAMSGSTVVPGAPQQLSVTVMSMCADLLFDSNSAALRPASETQLKEIARLLSNHPEVPVLIRGYTDSKGSPSLNRLLSKKRAEAVREWLVVHIANKEQNISVQGRSDLDPVMPNINPDGSDNPGGRQKNRRVTVTIPQHRDLQPAAPQMRAAQPVRQAQPPAQPAQARPVALAPQPQPQAQPQQQTQSQVPAPVKTL